jgi:hypothetical protein
VSVTSLFLAYGQSSSSLSSFSGAPPPLGVCNPITLQAVPGLTFKQRVCLYGQELITPKFALAAGFAAAFGQLENSPYVSRQHLDEFPHRVEVNYARVAARDSGELIAGYLHHEDPRYRRSMAHGIRRRTDAALMSVLTSPGEDGRLRLAYAPIAGSLTSALVGSVMYEHNETVEDTLTHVGLVYSHYFARAVFLEFKPEMTAFVHRILNHGK